MTKEIEMIFIYITLCLNDNYALNKIKGTEMKYLMRKKGRVKYVAHIWDGKDTLCRMASTGGLNLKSYGTYDSNDDNKICSMCKSVFDNNQEQEEKQIITDNEMIKMMTRKETVEFIKKQKEYLDYNTPNEKHNKWHYGLKELKELMDFIYQGKPKNKDEFINSITTK